MVTSLEVKGPFAEKRSGLSGIRVRNKMIEVGIVGASGYSGLELLRILIAHPKVEISKLFGDASSGKLIENVHASLRSVFSKEIEKFSTAALRGIDVLFVALPSGQAISLVPEALVAGCKVIDLGGDFRLAKKEVYEQYYGHEHTSAGFLGTAVYGLTEWNCEAIKNAKLLANPGCYPTSVQLALLPLVKEGLLDSSPIGIASYSGTSGAGRSVSEKMMFTEINESVRAYKVGNHQHIPEISQYVKEFGGRDVNFSFVPHLLPVTRGIYTTIHARLKNEVTRAAVGNAYASRYASAPFVRVVAPAIPEMKDVLYTNFCDMGFAVNEDMQTIVIFSTIDNLGKGAAGQAVQNMNVMFGFPQTVGLLPCYKKN